MLARTVVASAVLGLILTACATVDHKPPAEAKAALAPGGKLRVGLYLGNPLHVIREPDSGQMRGAGFELGRQLAQRLDVPYEPVIYPGVAALLEGAKSNQWDVAFLQITPARARDYDFSPPVFEIELGYLVPADSRISSLANADTAGIRIAVTEKGQSDVILTPLLKQATLVRVATLADATEAMKSGKADAIGTIKPTLFEVSTKLPGSRVLEGRYSTENVAMAVPKGRDAAISYVRKFIEEAKSQGLVRTAIEKAGARGTVVAP